jgi:flagellar hook-associated protein 1 FlgK
VRNLAVLLGDTLAKEIGRLADRTENLRSDVNGRIEDMADDINRLIDEIRVLNIRIAETEGGDISGSDAVGLRDQRLQALENLAKLIDIRVVEQPSGGVTVYRGGDFLVSDAIARPVEIFLDSDHGLTVADIHLAETDAPLNPVSGQLRGLLDARDEVLGQFLDDLDDFARTFIFEFNKLYSAGQGLTGYRDLTSTFSVDDLDALLNDAGLEFTPENGSFQILVYNTRTKLTQTTDIPATLLGIDEDDDVTLTNLIDALDAVDGISAEATATRGITITSTGADQVFGFANDTSGVLAALGLNTFFTGSSASDIGVNPVVMEDASKFAASRHGIGHDTETAIDLANFIDRPIAAENGASLAVLYDRLTGETTQGSTIARSVAEGARVFEMSLRGQKLAISGVNLDEEAMRMIGYQRAYQASARYIAALSELFDILVSI